MKSKSQGLQGAIKNPSYDKTLPIATRLADFLGKYHIVLNGVVPHSPFMLKYEGKPNERCDDSHKQEIIEFVDKLLTQEPKPLACEKHSRILIGKKGCVDCQEPKAEEGWEQRYRELFSDMPTSAHWYTAVAGFVVRELAQTRKDTIEEVRQWAKEHNLCSDLVATSSLMRFLDQIKK